MKAGGEPLTLDARPVVSVHKQLPEILKCIHPVLYLSISLSTGAADARHTVDRSTLHGSPDRNIQLKKQEVRDIQVSCVAHHRRSFVIANMQQRRKC